MDFSVAEQVATIVLTYLQRGTQVGKFGQLTVIAPTTLTAPGCDPVQIHGGYRVELLSPRKTFIVRSMRIGWEVSWKGFQGIDSDLEAAVRLALDADTGSNVTRITDWQKQL